MWHRTKLKKLQKGFVLDVYKDSIFIRQKMKFFLQANDLYKVEEQKLRVSDSNVVGGKSEIQLSLKVSWKKEKNEFGDVILTIRIHKDGSVLESRIDSAIPKLQSIFGKIISQDNLLKYYEVRLFLNKKDIREEINIMEEVEVNPQRFIQLTKYHKWEYIDYPHLLLGGETGSGKSRVLYGLIYKFLRETPKENVYICDGKNDDLYKVSKYMLELPNVGNVNEEIADYIKDVENIMDRRYAGQEQRKHPILLVVDEFAGVRDSMDKKEFEVLNKALRRIMMMGRAANIHIIMALQRPETSVLDGAIRDNFAIRIGLGNLKPENFKMIFGVNKDESILTIKEKGLGYISINGTLEQYESPWVYLPEDEKKEDVEQSEE